MPAQCPQLAARLQVFTGSFDLIVNPTGSPYLPTRASEMRSRILRVSFSWLRMTRHSSMMSTSRGLAELKPGNVTMQIGRIFRARRARLPSCQCWRRQVMLRSQERELVGLRKRHDDLRHRSDGCRGSSLVLLSLLPSGLSMLLNCK
jgi:hypothetical protein